MVYNLIEGHQRLFSRTDRIMPMYYRALAFCIKICLSYIVLLKGAHLAGPIQLSVLRVVITFF
jgi:hypothetical protein